MRRIILVALFLFAALPAHAQFWASSAVNGAGVSKKPLTAPSLTLNSGGSITIPDGSVSLTSATGSTTINPASLQLADSGQQLNISASAAGPIIAGTGALMLAGDTGVQIGATGTPIAASYRATQTIDIASIAANICATDSTITVTGAVTGAECIVGSPAALTAGLIQTCFVSAADTVKLRTCNSTAGAIDPASATYSVRVFNP